MTQLKRIMFLPALFFMLSGQVLGGHHETEAMEAAETVEAVEAAPADQACDMPAAPIIPDGNVASEDELVAAQKAMKAFQGKLIGYRECLQGLEELIDPEAEDAIAAGELLTGDYNVSVDAEERVAQEFNDAVRAFKARQE